LTSLENNLCTELNVTIVRSGLRDFPNDAVFHVAGFPGLAKSGWVSPLFHHFYVADGRHYEMAIVNVG
jgi:hypothetical protein